MRKFPNIKLGGLQLCNRDAICNAIVDHVPKDGARIVEIGVARGETLKGIADLLRQEGFVNYFLNGIDLDGGPWKFDVKKVAELLAGHPNAISTKGSLAVISSGYFAPESIHFLHIDGCHSQACFTQDFVLAEPLIALDGIVCIHDADIHCQGPDFDVQPHCLCGCEVRKALGCLGLLCGTRPGWKLLHDIEGAPSGENHGRGSVILQKIA